MAKEPPLCILDKEAKSWAHVSSYGALTIRGYSGDTAVVNPKHTRRIYDYLKQCESDGLLDASLDNEFENPARCGDGVVFRISAAPEFPGVAIDPDKDGGFALYGRENVQKAVDWLQAHLDNGTFDGTGAT